MMNHKDHFHGSDLEKIEKQYGIHKENIISFSANVNPLGLSDHLKTILIAHLDSLTTYPDREYTALRKAIGNYCQVDYQNIIVGNGSTELISLFIQLKNPSKTLILGPTYSEYEREVSLNGGEYSYFPLKEEDGFSLNSELLSQTLTSTFDLFIICNPNNPTSTALTKDQLTQILDLCLAKNIFVMIDETYVEFVEQESEISAVSLATSYPNLIVLRGVSKFYAAPGLRLGYAITSNQSLISQFTTQKNPWTINSIAEVAGTFIFSDHEYIQKTRALISSERTRIYQELSSLDGLIPYKPTANFILVRITREDLDADIVFDTAIKENLMIRNCSSFSYLNHKYFRFCFMNPQENDLLLSCLKTLFSPKK